MTLPSLFRKVGINVPRGVTVGGAVVLGSSRIQSASAASAITAMQPHRFHGGNDPAPSRSNKASAWWIQSPDEKQRDISDMRKRFANVTITDTDEELAYGVSFDTGRGKYGALILPQVNKSIPSVFMTHPKRLGRNEGRNFRLAPHLYLSGALCVADASDWDGKGFGTSVAAAWTAHWLACYTVWRMNGVWPAEGYEPYES
jgi:hypothetical protein